MSISKPISILDTIRNQVGFLSMGPNNANVGGNSRENIVAINSTIKSKEIEKSKKEAKVDLKVQPNTTIIALVSH